MWFGCPELARSCHAHIFMPANAWRRDPAKVRLESGACTGTRSCSFRILPLFFYARVQIRQGEKSRRIVRTRHSETRGLTSALSRHGCECSLAMGPEHRWVSVSLASKGMLTLHAIILVKPLDYN